jgi:transposase InsO family protein
VEAEPLATSTEANVRNFVWKIIICRFGIPRVIISNNGKQFDNDQFRGFCSELGIKNHYSSSGYPQANGQVEVTNITILKTLKARPERSKGNWPKELLGVLWSYRTTCRTPTVESPFRLAFGAEAVIPIEIGVATLRTKHFQEDTNEKGLRLNLDLLDETREEAALYNDAYQ